MNEPSWQSAAVALGLLSLIAAVAVASVVSYNADDALKIWTALGSLLGVVTGAVVAYFFARGTVRQADERAQTATESAEGFRDTLKGVQDQMEALRRHTERIFQASQEQQAALVKIMALLPKSESMKLIQDPTIERGLEAPPTPPPSSSPS